MKRNDLKLEKFQFNKILKLEDVKGGINSRGNTCTISWVSSDGMLCDVEDSSGEEVYCTISDSGHKLGEEVWC
jgi:hypothetical protein